MQKYGITRGKLDSPKTVRLYFDESEADYTAIAIETHYDRHDDGRVTERGKCPILSVDGKEISAIDLAHDLGSSNVSFDSAAVGEW